LLCEDHAKLFLKFDIEDLKIAFASRLAEIKKDFQNSLIQPAGEVDKDEKQA